MARALIAGNWKMNQTEQEALSLVRKLMQGQPANQSADLLICPPFTCLSQLHKLLVSSSIFLGAQNISHLSSGAYTGEISARMAAEFCDYVILGHSERRALYGEEDSLINAKIKAAQGAGLIPILCVGETLAEREASRAAEVLRRQLRDCLDGIQLDDPDRLVIAYEPVWAIGTGRSASPEGISELVASVIRPSLAAIWGEGTANQIRVLYGGSVNPKNAGGFFSQPEINGALIGGASLDPAAFLEIAARVI